MTPAVKGATANRIGRAMRDMQALAARLQRDDYTYTSYRLEQAVSALRVARKTLDREYAELEGRP